MSKKNNFFKKSFAVISSSFIAFIIWGCSTTAIIPTVTNPALEQISGIKAPFVKILGMNVTLQGFNDGIEEVADFQVDVTYPFGKDWASRSRERSNKIAMTILGVISAAGLTGSAIGIPVARQMQPKKKVVA